MSGQPAFQHHGAVHFCLRWSERSSSLVRHPGYLLFALDILVTELIMFTKHLCFNTIYEVDFHMLVLFFLNFSETCNFMSDSL